MNILGSFVGIKSSKNSADDIKRSDCNNLNSLILVNSVKLKPTFLKTLNTL